MLVLATLLAALCLACANAPVVSPVVSPAPSDAAERVTLAPSQSAAVGDDVRLRFDRVENDSRCPTGEQCVRAGSAEVAITVTYGSQSSEHRLFAGAEPRSLAFDGLAIELTALSPHPVTARRIDPADYRATFVITRARR